MHSFSGRQECFYSATNERRSTLTQYHTYSTSSPQDALTPIDQQNKCFMVFANGKLILTGKNFSSIRNTFLFSESFSVCHFYEIVYYII